MGNLVSTVVVGGIPYDIVYRQVRSPRTHMTFVAAVIELLEGYPVEVAPISPGGLMTGAEITVRGCETRFGKPAGPQITWSSSGSSDRSIGRAALIRHLMGEAITLAEYAEYNRTKRG